MMLYGAITLAAALASPLISYSWTAFKRPETSKTVPTVSTAHSPSIYCANSTGCTIKLLYNNEQSINLASSDKKNSSYDFFACGINTTTIAYSTAALYAYFFLELAYCKTFVDSSDKWGAFESETPLINLAVDARDNKLIQRLLVAIATQYQPIDDTLERLQSFLKDVDTEEYYLNLFVYRRSQLDSLHVGGIFPGKNQTIECAQERIQRLQILKKLVHIYILEKNLLVSTQSTDKQSNPYNYA